MILFWLHWVCVAAHRLSLAAVSGGGYFFVTFTPASYCGGFFLRSTGSRRLGLVAPWYMESSPDQGWNPCPLHWQAGSYPRHHQGSLTSVFLCVLLSGPQSLSFRSPPHIIEEDPILRSLITSAKTRFPNKITFIRSRG